MDIPASSLLVPNLFLPTTLFPRGSSLAIHNQNGRGGGIRTPTAGFGDRRSTIEPTPLQQWPKPPTARKLFHFFVRRVLTAILAKLSRLEPVGMLLPVLRSRVISVFAVIALQRDNFSHLFCSLS